MQLMTGHGAKALAALTLNSADSKVCKCAPPCPHVKHSRLLA